NAFNSIHHQHILQVLQQKGIDGHIINIVRDLYSNSGMRLAVGGTCLEKVKILTGVKLGDPMSPLLFSLSVDPLLCKLKEKKDGFKYGNNSVSSLALADDLVLLSDSWGGMQRNIQVVEEFDYLTGLKVQAAM
ncbi:PO21 protein, partial [Nothocercus julius]|nr:PO21 protein [Nothocercus julius]